MQGYRYARSAYISVPEKAKVCLRRLLKAVLFYEKNGFLPRFYRVTNRLVAKVICDFKDLRSAKEIGSKNNVSAQTALRYFKLVNYSCKVLPEVLSIDEFKGNAGGEKYQTILTDAKNLKIADILPNRKKSDLIKYFLRFENRKDVKYVVIDMNRYFKETAEICFLNAKIVIDRCHVTVRSYGLWRMCERQSRKHSRPRGEGSASI